MNIKKVVDICRKSGVITLINGKGMQWLGDGSAYYPLENAPWFDEVSLCATFGITDKQKESILLKVKHELPEMFDFESTSSGERFAERNDISLVYRNTDLLVFSSEDGALYMKAKYLAPVMAEGLEIYLRKTESGVPYFVCKQGWIVQAVIAPVIFEKKDTEFVSSLDLLHEQSVKRRGLI